VSRGVFVTGTDTGIGKTVACCALLHALAARGIAAMPMKPIAAGATEHGGRWINEDTALLLAAAGRDPSLAGRVTPVLLREPLAPHIAAAREGVSISLPRVLETFEALAAGGDFMVVEGVGGFCVPLGDGLDTVTLARRLALPVVMVVGLRLGCINHALLTAQAIEAAGLPLAGWIANSVDPRMSAREENIATLATALRAPLLGVLPHLPRADTRLMARGLDCSALLP